jgi:hypothetical protein
LSSVRAYQQRDDCEKRRQQQPGTSHHALLGACLDDTMLRRVDCELAANC